MEHWWLVTLKRGFYRLEPGVVVSSVYGWDLLHSVEMNDRSPLYKGGITLPLYRPAIALLCIRLPLPFPSYKGAIARLCIHGLSPPICPMHLFSLLIHQRPVILIEGCLGFLLYMTDLFPRIHPPSPLVCIRPLSAVFLVYGADCSSPPISPSLLRPV